MLVAQSCPIVCNLMGCSLPGSSIYIYRYFVVVLVTKSCVTLLPPHGL